VHRAETTVTDEVSATRDSAPTVPLTLLPPVVLGTETVAEGSNIAAVQTARGLRLMGPRVVAAEPAVLTTNFATDEFAERPLKSAVSFVVHEAKSFGECLTIAVGF
jgi:hypothetical protein